MSRNWNRKIQVVFGDRAIDLDDFDISFQYTFGAEEEPNEVEIEIKNLSQTTINNNIIKDKQLILNVGYEGDVGNLMKGYIADTTTGWAGTDKDTKIIGFDASDDYLNKQISKAYKEGILASEIIKDLCSVTGLAIGEISLFKDTQYTRGRSVSGKLRAILNEIVVDDCETKLQIINGSIFIRNIGTGLETGFILSPTTGLIGSPEPTTTTGDETDADGKSDYTVKCLLNYKIGPMSRIKIESKELVAEAVVVSGKHIGSKTGSFQTEIEVKLI